MKQDKESGAKAAKFGAKAAALIGEKIGAIKTSIRGNEFQWRGQNITIHSARQRTSDIGVTYATLERIQLIVGAFEISPDEYELRSISPALFNKHMRDSLTGRGAVGLVRKKIFFEQGERITTLKLSV